MQFGVVDAAEVEWRPLRPEDILGVGIVAEETAKDESAELACQRNVDEGGLVLHLHARGDSGFAELLLNELHLEAGLRIVDARKHDVERATVFRLVGVDEVAGLLEVESREARVLVVAGHVLVEWPIGEVEEAIVVNLVELYTIDGQREGLSRALRSSNGGADVLSR